jgi:AmmeMemoRadiSam system protein A
MISTDDQRILRELAHSSIKHGLETGKPVDVDTTQYSAELQAKKATFVTLHRDKKLRGCIGILKPIRPLVEDVAYNAWAAAFTDNRFMPLSAKEFDDLDVHISILGIPEDVAFSSEDDLIQKLRPGVDGLILEEGINKGTFLPSVWESLTDPRDFLSHLKLKAGLPQDFWSDQIKIKRYTVEEF